METNNDSKETQQIEKKQSAEMNNKNKLYNFLNKRKISSENKDTQDQLESSINLNNNKPYQNNANYLNTLLKKSFYDTINNNSTSNTSPSKQSKENNNALIYPSKVPRNFIPIYLYENINLDSNKKTTRQMKNELRNVLDLYEKQKNEMIKCEKEIEKTKEDLKRAKEAKNIIMEEVFQIKKEIENLKENDNINISNINNNRSRLSMQVGNINNLLKSLNMNDIYEENRKKNEELDNEIREYEDKITKLKFDNTNFMEDYDMLMNDYKNNLNKNLKIKEYISNIDKKTKEALKEKEDLKKYINKMGKI
jgi:hypothetical protein